MHGRIPRLVLAAPLVAALAVTLTASGTAPRGADARLSASLHGSTGLGYAGGRWGWGRPVQGGFVIVDQKRRRGAAEFRINPRPDGTADAWWSPLAPALLPQITPYRSNEVTIRGAEREEVFSVKPRNGQGTLVLLGDDGMLQIHAFLRHSDGRPAALSTGVIRCLTADSETEPSANFFTNQDGELWASLRRWGEHQIELDGPDGRAPLTANFVVPESATFEESSTLEIGELQLRP